ncbi:CBS domain-containing protein [Streptomyces pristinaespiralis]|uniref:Oxidoreductase n=1 Tax=Streptomyces pristinaespiralis TaxID=38300 RepID=A0A0M5IVC7_STRPR|nr:CBS domain-containing protein [Streptomyces pristinaespiralis]ALC25211.1 oxidoreductase [Streptomyces pristinaespiralis]
MAELVREVMTAGVAAVRPDASLVEAARLMRDLDIGDVLVADGDTVVGMLTDRDITLRSVAEGADPTGVSASSACTPDPVCVTPDDSVASAVRLMRTHAVRRLPVVEDGRPLGVVSLGDLAAAEDPHSVLAEISVAESNNERS